MSRIASRYLTVDIFNDESILEIGGKQTSKRKDCYAQTTKDQ